MANRAATSGLFGFDFQTNAAIVIMLEHIRDVETIRLEGKEDIEILLNDNSYILSQAKAVVKSSTDFNNVKRNLKNALISLSDTASSRSKIKQLVYITNSPNPFNEKIPNTIFYGEAHREYKSLPEPLQLVIRKYLSEITPSLDPSKLMLQILPFETDNDTERYKCVIKEVENFIYKLGNIRVPKDELHGIWVKDIFKSGTRNDQELRLTKKDIIWPVIVFATNDMNYDEFDCDDSEIEEINILYKDLINNSCEKYEFITKILCSYNGFQSDKKHRERMENFIKIKYKDYLYILEGNNLSIAKEIKIKLLQIIIRNILCKRIQINNIKNSVNL